MGLSQEAALSYILATGSTQPSLRNLEPGGVRAEKGTRSRRGITFGLWRRLVSAEMHSGVSEGGRIWCLPLALK